MGNYRECPWLILSAAKGVFLPETKMYGNVQKDTRKYTRIMIHSHTKLVLSTIHNT